MAFNYFYKPISIWSVSSIRIFNAFGIEFNNKIMHLVFDSKKKYFQLIHVIFGIKSMIFLIKRIKNETIDLTRIAIIF